jgi:hypothetical protein
MNELPADAKLLILVELEKMLDYLDQLSANLMLLQEAVDTTGEKLMEMAGKFGVKLDR